MYLVPYLPYLTYLTYILYFTLLYFASSTGGIRRIVVLKLLYSTLLCSFFVLVFLLE